MDVTNSALLFLNSFYFVFSIFQIYFNKKISKKIQIVEQSYSILNVDEAFSNKIWNKIQNQIQIQIQSLFKKNESFEKDYHQEKVYKDKQTHEDQRWYDDRVCRADRINLQWTCI